MSERTKSVEEVQPPTPNESAVAAEFAAIWRPRRLLYLAVRCAIVALFMGHGFALLAYLRSAQKTSRVILVNDLTLTHALQIGLTCIPSLLCIVMLVECQIVLLVAFRNGWRRAQVFFPIFTGACGAFFAWFLFRLPEHGPKETMLVAGGALATFLATTLQLALWRLTAATRNLNPEFPAAWYAAFLLLAATFLGGMRGWSDYSPQLKVLLDYRDRQWAERSDVPRLPLDPVERPFH